MLTSNCRMICRLLWSSCLLPDTCISSLVSESLHLYCRQPVLPMVNAAYMGGAIHQGKLRAVHVQQYLYY